MGYPSTILILRFCIQLVVNQPSASVPVESSSIYLEETTIIPNLSCTNQDRDNMLQSLHVSKQETRQIIDDTDQEMNNMPQTLHSSNQETPQIIDDTDQEMNNMPQSLDFSNQETPQILDDTDQEMNNIPQSLHFSNQETPQILDDTDPEMNKMSQSFEWNSILQYLNYILLQLRTIFQSLLEGTVREWRNLVRNHLKPNLEYTNRQQVTIPRHMKRRSRGDCQLVLQEDLDPTREPLILSSDGSEIVIPDELDGKISVINIGSQDTLLLACPADEGANEIEGELECKSGKLTVDGKRASASSTSCADKYASSAVRVTRRSCGTGDEVEVEIGYQILEDDGKKWVSEIVVCHNVEGMYSLYAVHKLHGQVIKGGMKGGNRRSFSVSNSNLFRGVNPDKFYSKKAVTEVLNILLGSGAGKSLVAKSRFIARGHLAPVADFVYFAGQMATMFYVNTAPQWQSFNAGNWLSVEKTTRTLAAAEEETLTVYTGTYGVQTLSYKSKRSEFYLAMDENNNEVMPVPEVFWKLLFNPVTKACIAVVGHNDIFAKKPPKTLCRPLTQEWPTLDKLDSGYTYFCDYKSFRDIASYIPDVDCDGILNNPN